MAVYLGKGRTVINETLSICHEYNLLDKQLNTANYYSSRSRYITNEYEAAISLPPPPPSLPLSLSIHLYLCFCLCLYCEAVREF